MGAVLVASWNVNSLHVRLPQVLDYLEEYRPDVLALQETKLPDEKFPRREIEAAGYRVCHCGQRTYNGVAILSRAEARDILTSLPRFEDAQRRLLAATVDGVRYINVYIPNGQEVGSEKYQYKFCWLEGFSHLLAQELQRHERLVVLGDFNIAPADIDVHDPPRWQGRIMCSEAERAGFRKLLDLGLVDVVRSLHPKEGMYTWWDYRLNAYKRGWGLRIDHILASPAMKAVAAGVHRELRQHERPSDHAPVWAQFEVKDPTTP